MKVLFISVILSLVLVSCAEEPWDDELSVYMKRFKQEAARRGIKVDYNKNSVEARIEFLPNDIALGRCSKSTDAIHKVTINALFWETNDELQKERLVFHELGHCVLNRNHKDSKDGNGFCISIMHSGQSCLDLYSFETREAYLDELFY